jgi:hypothetical protein
MFLQRLLLVCSSYPSPNYFYSYLSYHLYLLAFYHASSNLFSQPYKTRAQILVITCYAQLSIIQASLSG